MASILTVDISFAWTCLWQSTLTLGAGLIAARLLVRRAAHAHSILSLAVIVAVAAPALTLVSARAGWGVFERSAPAVGAPRSDPEQFAAAQDSLVQPIPMVPAPESPDVTSFAAIESMRASPTPTTDSPASLPPLQADGPSNSPSPVRLASNPISWPRLLALSWLTVSLLLLVRVVASAWAGHRVVEAASPIRDDSIERGVRAACERLGLRVCPILLRSPLVSCPALWRWRRRPVLLLPASWKMDEQGAIGVLCHELAHWARGDGWTRLLADLAICVLPFQPLLWFASVRIRQLSERACDDWALSTGVAPAHYAEALLALVPQRRPSIVLAAVSSRSALIERVHHILRSDSHDARLSGTWRSVVGVVGCSVLVVTALAQPRAAAPPRILTPGDAPMRVAPSADDRHVRASKPTIAGRVVDSKGSAVVGASVWLISTEKPASATVIATLTTDEAGRFEFPDGVAIPALEPVFPRCRVVAEDAEGRLGWTDELRQKTGAALDLVLHETGEASGRLQDESGAPIASATLVVENVSSDPYSQPHYPLMPLFAPVRDRMKTTSKEDGTFALMGMPAGGSVVARIEAAGVGTVLASWNVGKPQAIRLSRAGSIRGRVVVDGSGPPNEEVKLWCSGGDASQNVKEYGGDGYRCWTSIPGITAQSDGTFQIEGLPAGDYFISLSMRDASPFFGVKPNTEVHVDSGRCTGDVRVELTRGTALRGRVVDPDAAGVSGVTLTVCYLDKSDVITDQRTAETGPDGTFVGYVRGDCRALVAVKRAPAGFVPDVAKQHMKLEVSGDMDWPTIVLKRAGRIEGVVIDEHGKPVAKAEVRCDAPWDQFLESREIAGRTIVCDDDGAFSINQLDPDDNAAVRARFGDAVTAEPVVLRPGVPRSEIQLTLSSKAAYCVRGRIVDSAGAPIDGATATLYWQRRGTSIVHPGMGFGGPFEYIRCGPDGKFESGALWPDDEYFVQASASGCAGAESPRFTGVAGESREIEPLVLERLGGVLAGRVVDSAGAPIEDARVTCGDAAGLRGTNPVLSQSDGSFRFTDVAGGLIYVFAEKKGYRFTMARAEAGAAVTVRLPRDDQPPPPFDPDRGAPTAQQRRAAALRILDHIWSRPDLRESRSMLSLIMYLSRIDPDRAETWCDEIGGKYIGFVRMARFRAAAASGLAAALPLLGDAWSGRFVDELLDMAEGYAARGQTGDALLLADAIVGQLETLDELPRTGAKARAGALLLECGRAKEGKGLLRAAVLASQDLAVSGMDAYWRGTVATALARSDIDAALKLIEPIAGEHEKPRWVRRIARQVAAVDLSRAEMLITAQLSDVMQRDQAYLRLADAAANTDLNGAIRLSETIGQPYYRAQAFGRLALAAFPRDGVLARQLIDRALDTVVEGRDRTMGFTSLGGPSFLAAAIAYEAQLVGHPDLPRFVQRSLSLRLMTNFTAGAREAYCDQLRTLAMLALIDPATAREVLIHIEPRLAGLPPDPSGQVSIAHLTAWALADPDHAADLAIAAIDRFVAGDDPIGFWSTGVPAAIEVLTAAPEDRLAEGSLLILNTALWHPGRE